MSKNSKQHSENLDLQTRLDAWNCDPDGKQIVLVTAGKSGAGKSTLINNFLDLEESERAVEGYGAKSGTLTVKTFETVKGDVRIQIVDTPGLGSMDIKSTDYETVAQLTKVTQGKANMLVYCVSMNLGNKVTPVDVACIRKLTTAFSAAIWKRTILALTFANMLNDDGDWFPDYESIVKSYTEQFEVALKEAGVSNVPVRSILAEGDQGNLAYDGIIAVPVGKKPEKPLPRCNDWPTLLRTAVLRRCDPKDIPAMLHVTSLWNYAVGGVAVTGGGAGAGAGVGAGIGAGIGVAFGGVGAVPGAMVGAAIGGGVGAAGSAGTGTALYFQQIKDIIMIKWEQRKLEQKK